MNVESIKTALIQKTGRTSLYLQKHSPEILLGAGLVGMVATVYLAAKATLDLEEVVNISKETLDQLEENAKEAKSKLAVEDFPEVNRVTNTAKAKVYVATGLHLAKLYGPALGVGVLSVAAILASHGIMVKRQVALVGAYNLAVEAYKQYRERVVDELGAEKERDLYLGLKDETRTETEIQEDGTKKKVKKTEKVLVAGNKAASIYSRFFDESNPQYRSDRLLNKAFLTAQQNYMNDVLIIRGHVFLNEVYDALGFPHTKEGAIVGWVLKDPETMRAENRDGYIDFGIYDVNDNPGREFVNLSNPSILLDFNVDGVVYDQI